MSYEVTNELDHLPFLRWNKNKRKLYNFFLKDLNLPRKFFDIQRILLVRLMRDIYSYFFFSPSLDFGIPFQAEEVIVFHNSRGLSYNRDMQLHEKNIKQMRLQIFSTQILRYFV